MNKKEYYDKLYAYWHMDLPEEERKSIWSQIQLERQRREKIFFYKFMVAVILCIVLIMILYSKCSYVA